MNTDSNDDQSPLALEWARRELDRVWAVSDAADNKLLLSASVLSSVFTALLVATTLRTEAVASLPAPFQWCMLSGFVVVLVGLVTMLWTTKTTDYYAPFEPEQLIDEPRYMQSNTAFSSQVIKVIDKAFQHARVANRKKLSRFRRALFLTLLGIALFAAAPLGAIYFEGVRMSDKPSSTPAPQEGTPSTPAPTSNPAPSREPLKPLRPYLVERDIKPGQGGRPPLKKKS